MHTTYSVDYAIARCLSSVCMSVCHTPVAYSVETAQHIIKLFSPSGRYTIQVFLHQTVWQYSDGTPNVAVEYISGGGMKTCDFRPISRFISEMIRGRAIDTIYFEWYQFQFHWMTSNSYFKVTIFSSDTVLERKSRKKHKHRPKTRNRRRDRRKEIDNNYII